MDAEPDYGGETQAKFMSDLLWNTTPDLINVLEDTQNAELSETDLLALEIARKVLSVIKDKPQIGQNTETSFDIENKPEKQKVLAGVGGVEDRMSGLPSHIPEYIKGNAKIKRQYHPDHDYASIDVDIRLDEILGEMILPDNMPTNLAVRLDGTFTDTMSKNLGVKNTLPSVSVAYFLHTADGKMESNFLHLYLAPPTLPIEEVETRLLHENVVATDRDVLTALLERSPIETIGEKEREDDVLIRKEMIYNLGKHRVGNVPGESRVFLVNSKKAQVSKREK